MIILSAHTYIIIMSLSIIFTAEILSESHNMYSKENSIFFNEYLKAKDMYANYTCSGYKCYANTIKSDLEPFLKGIGWDLMQTAAEKGIMYVVKNKRIYRGKNCLFPSRCEGVDYFLNSIKDSIPDTQFIVNFHDWPQVKKHFYTPLPVFSFSKTDDYYDIMYPAWSFWKGGPALKLYPTGIGRYDQFYKSLVDESEMWPWEKKYNKGFFIGSRTNSERDNLVLLSRNNEELVDAKYTKNQAWKSIQDTLNHLPADEVPLERHCHYRFLFNFRGVAASFRFKFLFLCKSVVIHVGNEWKEFFYDGLKPWYHYIPMDSTASQNNYKNILKFLQEEDDIAQSIANRGFNFIYNNLKMDDIKGYWKDLLTEYTKLLRFSPKLHDDLIDVTTD